MTTFNDHKHFYVSAIDGQRRFLISGPYATHAEAIACVDTVRGMAVEQDGRAHFMMWGTAGSVEPIKTPLGSIKPVSAATAARIGRVYEAWVGYNAIHECGLDPRTALQTLREYRAERSAA